MTILKFEGDYEFLSNFYPCEIYPNGVKYSSVEHAFQSLKTLDPTAKEIIRRAETPGKAKRLGRKVSLRIDWEYVKIDFMLKLLRMKFSDPELSKKLLSTNEGIKEGNNWNDLFWGVDINTGNGSNMLGKLLMIVREEQRNNIFFTNRIFF